MKRARRAHVLAFDSDGRYLELARWAARELDPARHVSFRQCQVYELGNLPRP